MGRTAHGRAPISKRQHGHQIRAEAGRRRPHGMALGGGCEIALHATNIHAAAETYMGLVEAGVGLIPGGGGTKEMIIRANEHAASGDDLDLFHTLRPVFENIATAKVSTSARRSARTGISCAATILVDESRSPGRRRQANRAGAWSAADGIRPLPRGRKARRPRRLKCWANRSWRAAKIAIHLMAARRIRLRVRRACRPQARQHSCRRRVFLAAIGQRAICPRSGTRSLRLLCGERKTQERIAHTLKTGKPLRN